MNYLDFIGGKLSVTPSQGMAGNLWIHPNAFDHQSALTRWALKRGRAAIFADTGLGKMLMALMWARNVWWETGMPVIILTPLAVTMQFLLEAEVFGIRGVHVVKSQADVQPGINITNYDRLHLFDPDTFGGVVLDESSRIKHADSQTFSLLTKAFAQTPFKLAETATPAPNDWTELGTHAEWLGVCTEQEMLAEFFVHDGGDTNVWRLKRHAQGPFWKWVVSWGALIRRPSDLGFDDDLYVLPALHVRQHLVEHVMPPDDSFFPEAASTLSERRAARRMSMDARIEACVTVANSNKSEPYLVWCDLNDESKALTAAIDGAVEVTGSDDPDLKEKRLLGFATGEHRVLVSKPKIAGWGLNWQHCNRMGFVGVTDSYEAYYQAIRRCYRFGQKREVHVDIFASRLEGAVVANLQRKEQDGLAMAEALSAETRDSVMKEVTGLTRETNAYNAVHAVQIPNFL